MPEVDGMRKCPEGAPDIRSSFTREASGPIGRGRFPGSRVYARPLSFPGVFPEWRRLQGAIRGGLAGYSGGTAQAFYLLPFYPLTARGTPT